MKWLIGGLTALLLCGSCAAQSVELPKEVRGRAGAFISVPARTVDSTVSWFSADPGLDVFPSTLLRDTKTAVVISMRPGKYRLFAVSAKEGIPSPFAVCVVVVEGDTPGPTPGPGPQPGPTPDPFVPTTGPLYVVIIEETGEAAAERGRLFADPTIAARFREKGHRFRVVDKDVIGVDGQPPADVRRFLDSARGKKLPQVFLVDKEGRTVVSGDLPTTPSGLLELIQKAGG